MAGLPRLTFPWALPGARADSRARLHELVLCQRAAAVSSELLEVAALLDWRHECDSVTASELHRLLTDGCTSPLLIPDVPIIELVDVLHRAAEALRAEELSGVDEAASATVAEALPEAPWPEDGQLRDRRTATALYAALRRAR